MDNYLIMSQIKDAHKTMSEKPEWANASPEQRDLEFYKEIVRQTQDQCSVFAMDWYVSREAKVQHPSPATYIDYMFGKDEYV